MYRLVFIVCCAAASLLAFAGPAAAGAPITKTVSASVDVEGGKRTSLSLSCPRTMVALGGSARSVPGGLWPRVSQPVGVHGWNFQFREPEETGVARVELRCLRLRIPTGYTVGIRVSTAHDTVRIPGRSERTATLRCARGFIPTGYGWREPDSYPPGVLTRAIGLPRRYEFTARSLNLVGGELKLYARCLERRAPARNGSKRKTHRFRIRRSSFRDSAREGSPVAHRCPAGRVSVSAGFALEPGGFAFGSNAHTEGKAGAGWSFYSLGDGSDNVRTYLTCLKTGTRFKRTR